MFIEKLWKENPGAVEAAIKKICKIDDESYLTFIGIEDGVLKCHRYGHVPIFIQVSDFYVRTTYSGTDYENSLLSMKWVKFMYQIFGDKYAFQYISYRNKKLDKFVEEYNDQTKKILNGIGFNVNNDKTK